MIHASHPVAPHETVLGLLASSGRRLSFGSLALVSLGAGAIPVLANLTSHASWQLLAGCYLIWCFSAWGTLFHDHAPGGVLARGVEAILVGSGMLVFSGLFIAFFFATLGPSWVP